MKTVKILFYGILLSLLATACERDYDAPPLSQPKYNGEQANTTIAKLKEIYASTGDVPSLIEPEFIINVKVIGNDISGNIFKQLYVEDATGAINIGIEQSSLYSSFRVGQELFIHLKGMSIVKFAGEFQIGYAGTNANRIPWAIFSAQAFTNDWPNAKSVQPTTVQLSSLSTDMVNRLIRLENVYFVNAGKNTFAANSVNTNEPLKDQDGRTIDVRTSSYAKFANETLPNGNGTIVGLLGRYNGSWQLLLRSIDDVIGFQD